MSGIRLIVGLGNPGREYERTRHNAGFWFVQRLAAAHGSSLSSENRFHGAVARIGFSGQVVWLLAPSTFMNRSGQAVAALANFHKIDTAQILVAHDELDMAPGQARLKLGGGVAGHNGLKDIRARCGGDGFWRLRVGIAHPRDRNPHQPVVDYVLRAPDEADLLAIDHAIDAALDCVPALVRGEHEAAMLRLHTAVGKPPRPG